MIKTPRKREWRVGDLVLFEAGPKVHAQLMEIVEIRGAQARLSLLYLNGEAGDSKQGPQEVWSLLDALVDPALYIKTEEFFNTLRAQANRGAEKRT